MKIGKVAFKDSKIKDVCYHGTSSEPFDELDKERIQKDPEDGDSGYFGWGFYLSTDRRYAEEFGDTVLEFFVDVRNPFTFDSDDYSDLVEYIFNDSDDRLESHIQGSMYALRLIGRNKGLEFRNTNDKELNEECLSIYDKYNGKTLDESAIAEIEGLYAKLAKNVSNWLNGVFMHFGRELFHYFTSNGYDGVIALGGKEVVVYETEQLRRIAVDDEKSDAALIGEDLRIGIQVGSAVVNKSTGKVGKVVSSDGRGVSILFEGSSRPMRISISGDGSLSSKSGDVTGRYSSVMEAKVLTEDIDLDVIETPHWEEGSDSLMDEIRRYCEGNPDCTEFHLWNKLYPMRGDSVWYAGDNCLMSFIYQNKLEVSIYAGGEMYLKLDPEDDADYVYSPDELPDNYNIYTDSELYDRTDDIDDAWDENNTYFLMTFTPLDRDGNILDTLYGPDCGWDEVYNIAEFLPISKIFDDVIPEFIDKYGDEYWPEPSDFEETEADRLFEKIPEEYADLSLDELKAVAESPHTPPDVSDAIKAYLREKRFIESVDAKPKAPKQHITREKVLKDVIGEFGYVSADKLTDAVYILPNGRILDTQGHNDTHQHENIAKYLNDKYGMDDLSEGNGSTFMDDIGAIRVTPWIPAIVIPANYLTEKQEKSLSDVLSVLNGRITDDTPLMVSNLSGSQFIEYRKALDNPDDVLTSILGYQVFGILRESKSPTHR